MKKLIGWLVLILFLAVYLISDSPWMQTIAWKRYRMTNAFGSDRYRFGDLYNFSDLKDYRFPMDADGAADTLRYSTCTRPRDINLYTICDSYLFEFIKGEKDFCRVNKYASVRTIDDGPLNIALDTTKINVLLIERTERYIRWHLSNPNYYITYRLTKGGGPERMIHLSYPITDYTFNKDLNENLEFNLFDYHFLSPIKQFKAWFNKTVFNRLDGNVAITPNGDRLLLKRTIDTTDEQSSFSALTDNEVAAMAGKLDEYREILQTDGF